jgi:hypothetical protein
MFEIQEDPRRSQDAVDFPIKLLLSNVGLMMDGEAGYHNVETTPPVAALRPGTRRGHRGGKVPPIVLTATRS